MIDIGTLGGLGSHGYGINDMGQVTGWADHGNANSTTNALARRLSRESRVVGNLAWE